MRRLILALALLAGCSPSRNSPSVICTPPECAYTTPLALVAEVDPPSDSLLVRQELTSFTIEPSGLFTLTLDAPITLRGTVRIGGSAGTPAPSATLVATRASRISGRPDVYYQASANATTGLYQLVVSRTLAGEHYSVRVLAGDQTQLPPLRMDLEATTDQTLDFTFPDPATLPVVHGVIRDSLQSPIIGMQVQAIDPKSGAVVSTTATTDLSGSYSLKLVASPPATVAIVATPLAGVAAPLLPTLSLPLDVSQASAASPLSADLSLPPLPTAARTIYEVMGVGTSGAATPVVGATCVFTADVSDAHAANGMTATYKVTAMTDGSGNASVQLYPAVSGNRQYQVTVTPDASSSFQAASTTVTVAPQGGYAQAIMLALRPQLSGRVLDPSGSALAGVVVQPVLATLAQQLSPATAATRPVPVAPPQSTTGADGRFAVRLDPASWDVGLLPPATSMLPRLWLAGTSVMVDTDVGTIGVPRGVMVHGGVRDAAGNSVPLADVRLYTVAASNAGCAGPTDFGCLAPARLRAEGPTDASGIVRLILPSQPVD